MRMTASDPYGGVYWQTFDLVINSIPYATDETIQATAYVGVPFAFTFNSSHIWDDNDENKTLILSASLQDRNKKTLPTWI